jgi:cobalt transporter subunit CbtA
MTKRMIVSAVFAGVAAGLIAALLHFAFVQKYILLGEMYETGAVTHFSSGSSAHDHAEPVADTEPLVEPAAGHSDHHAIGAADWQRNGLTALFMLILYTSYGLLLTAGFAFANSLGRKIGPSEGMMWGLTGFAAFQLAPAMGLAPELPGTIAADLGARQVWWWGTVIGTGSGIALLAYGRKIWMFVLAGALLALPHVIGAPEPEGYFGAAPPEIAAAFAARVLGVALVVWACLGWFAGHFWATSET